MRMGFLIAYMQFNWVINMTMKWFGTKVERKFHLFIHFNREDCSQISAGCDPHSAMRMSFLSWRVIVQNPHWHVCKYATIRLRMHAGGWSALRTHPSHPHFRQHSSVNIPLRGCGKAMDASFQPMASHCYAVHWITFEFNYEWIEMKMTERLDEHKLTLTNVEYVNVTLTVTESIRGPNQTTPASC